MIRRLRVDWLAWLLVVGALTALIGPIRLMIDIGRPFGGYITFQRAATQYNEVDGNTPSWWSGMAPGLLQHGDFLISIDGQDHATSARSVYESAYENGISTVEIEALQDGEVMTAKVPVRLFTLLDYLDVRLPDLITGLVLWLAGIIVYLARPDQPANRAFALATATAGFGRILYVHTVFFDRMALGTEMQLQLWLSVLGPSLYLLAIRFPYPSTDKLARPFLIAFIALGAIAFGLTVYSRLDSPPISLRATAGEIAYYLTILLLYSGLAALMVRLVMWFFESRNSKRDRRIALILLFGWFLTLPPIIASGLNAVAVGGDSSYYFFYGLDLRYMFLFAPLAFAFVLVRYHAMQAPSPLFIFLIVLTTSALTAAFLAWVWSLIHQYMPDADNSPPFLSLFIAALAIGVFWTTIAKLPQLLGRTLAWDRYTSISAREFGRRVSANMDLSRTPETIARAIVDEFELNQCALWLAAAGSPDLHLVAHAGNTMSDLPRHIEMKGRTLPNTSYPFRPSLVTDPNAPWAQNSPESEQIEVVVPLAMETRVLGVMGLGPRWDEDVFDSRILDIFEIVGQQATLLLDVTQHVDELQRVPGKLVDAQERERQRLAQELHDTVQQFFGRLPFYLAVSRDSFETDPAGARDLIERSINDVEEAAQAVRQIRHNLAPSQLDRGLVQALSTLTVNFQRRTGLTTTLTFDEDLDARTNLETRHAIYRVVQQALNNVELHAGASRVTVQLMILDDQIIFIISDNGRGSTEEERLIARANGSFGVESMTARLASSGGGLSILSTPGYGLEVKGWVPAITPKPTQSAAETYTNGSGNGQVPEIPPSESSLN